MDNKWNLFEKKFVHFLWDDDLKGKKVFVSDNIVELQSLVNNWGDNMLEIEESQDGHKPFKWGVNCYTFAYYDPNYLCKKAFKQGKQIQRYVNVSGIWINDDYPIWENGEYRISPSVLKREEEEQKLANYKKQGKTCEECETRYTCRGPDSGVDICSQFKQDKTL